MRDEPPDLVKLRDALAKKPAKHRDDDAIDLIDEEIDCRGFGRFLVRATVTYVVPLMAFDHDDAHKRFSELAASLSDNAVASYWDDVAIEADPTDRYDHWSKIDADEMGQDQ